MYSVPLCRHISVTVSTAWRQWSYFTSNLRERGKKMFGNICEREGGRGDRRRDGFGSLEQEIGHQGIMTDTGINAHPAKPALLIDQSSRCCQSIYCSPPIIKTRRCAQPINNQSRPEPPWFIAQLQRLFDATQTEHLENFQLLQAAVS